jgi:hypothetical protein
MRRKAADWAIIRNATGRSDAEAPRAYFRFSAMARPTRSGRGSVSWAA